MPNINFLYEKDGKCFISLHVSPGSKKDQIGGIHDNRLKVSITAPPVDGKANKHLIKFLSKILHCPKSHLTVEKGETSKLKLVSVQKGDRNKILLLLNL